MIKWKIYKEASDSQKWESAVKKGLKDLKAESGPFAGYGKAAREVARRCHNGTDAIDIINYVDGNNSPECFYNIFKYILEPLGGGVEIEKDPDAYDGVIDSFYNEWMFIVGWTIIGDKEGAMGYIKNILDIHPDSYEKSDGLELNPNWKANLPKMEKYANTLVDILMEKATISKDETKAELEKCKKLDKAGIADWIRNGGICMYGFGLPNDPKKALSSEEALELLPNYDFDSWGFQLFWNVVNNRVVLCFKELHENDLFEESGEVNLKKLLRQNGVTKLPSGTKLSYDGKLEWSKHKGHAGAKTIRNMCIQLEHAGWKRGDWTTGGIPDGSSVANRQTYTSPDGKILMSYTEYYGCTSYDNSFYITFKLAESPANESADWNDGGVDDNINPKFADLRDAFDKIDDGGFQWSSGKWRIRPDELGYDWKIYYDGEGWIGTVNYKTREYDVWNTKVVKKHEIKDFLHACAADSFKPMNTVSESTIKGAGRVVFEDDLVAVYTPDGKIEYKGLFDYCPYKDDDMRYDKTTMTYRIEGSNGDYRTMAKLAESCRESSRFGFNIGDKVELTSELEPNRFSDRGAVPAGTVGEVVAVDKPMRGVIKVKIGDGTVVSVPERRLKFAGTDNEPWKTLAANHQPKPKRDVKPERPEDYYMRPTTYGSPRYTGD